MNGIRLTAKGERWMLNVIGYGTATLLSLAFLTVLGFCGWIEGLA